MVETLEMHTVDRHADDDLKMARVLDMADAYIGAYTLMNTCFNSARLATLARRQSKHACFSGRDSLLVGVHITATNGNGADLVDDDKKWKLSSKARHKETDSNDNSIHPHKGSVREREREAYLRALGAVVGVAMAQCKLLGALNATDAQNSAKVSGEDSATVADEDSATVADDDTVKVADEEEDPLSLSSLFITDSVEEGGSDQRGTQAANKSIVYKTMHPRLPKDLELNLPPPHPLWANHLWNGGRWMARRIEEECVGEGECVWKNGRVIELGAGCGLPGILVAMLGSTAASGSCADAERAGEAGARVIISDYPDPELINTLQSNINMHLNGAKQTKDCLACGYLWGASTSHLGRFNAIIASDLIFNHSEHKSLLTAFDLLLSPVEEDENACIWMPFTHYRPWLRAADLDFFRLAREAGWIVEELESVVEDSIFMDDCRVVSEDERLLLRTIFVYRLMRGGREECFIDKQS